MIRHAQASNSAAATSNSAVQTLHPGPCLHLAGAFTPRARRGVERTLVVLSALTDTGAIVTLGSPAPVHDAQVGSHPRKEVMIAGIRSPGDFRTRGGRRPWEEQVARRL